MAYDLVVLGIRGHPVPESRREGWRAFSDDSMEAFGHGAIRFSHLGDLRQHGTLSLPLASLHLLDSVPYRATFLLSERLAIRGRALGRLLRALLCRFHGIRFVFSELKNFFTSSSLAFQSASLDPCCRDCSQPSEPAFSMGFESSSIRPLSAYPKHILWLQESEFLKPSSNRNSKPILAAIFRRWRVPFHRNIIHEGLEIHFLLGFLYISFIKRITSRSGRRKAS